jgi:hypothetical protein
MIIWGLGDRFVVVETTLSVKNWRVQFAAELTSMPEKNGWIFAIYCQINIFEVIPHNRLLPTL